MQRKRSRGKRAARSSKSVVIVVATTIVVIAIVVVGYLSTYMFDNASHYPVSAAVYKPNIDPSDFSVTISNKYLHMKKGTAYLYEKQTAGSVEQIEISLSDKIKTIGGFRTVEYHEKRSQNGEVLQEVISYIAQDKKGNVWSFGEKINNYQGGKLVDHKRSWVAGEAGTQPGIIMKENPEVGQSFRQNYSQGNFEDTSDIVAVQETVAAPYGTFTDCVKTYDWTPLDPKSQNNTYYCPEIGGVALSVNLIEDTRVELVDIKMVQ